jgi:hypothetical protein
MYKWNINNIKILSPTMDSFSFNTFKSKEPSRIGLKELVMSSVDPHKKDVPEEEKKKKKPLHWSLWIMIIIVLLLITGGLVYSMMNKTDDEDYDNLVVVDEDGEEKIGYDQVKDD